MPQTTHVHHPASFPFQNLAKNQVREKPMADVISSELALHAVFRLHIGHGHDSCVVYQDVNMLGIGIDFFTCVTSLRLRAEIELEKSGGEGRDCVLEDGISGSEFGEVAAGEDEAVGRVVGNLKGNFGSEAALRHTSDEYLRR